MKIGGVALGVALTVGATIAAAAVTQSQFPPRTVRDLIEICAPAKEDPMMTAAINYCMALPKARSSSRRRTKRSHRDASCFVCPLRRQPKAPR